MREDSCCILAQDWPEEDSSRASRLRQGMEEALRRLIEEEGVRQILTDVNRGPSLWAAELVVELKETQPVELVCCLPYEEQTTYWSERDRNHYFRVMERCDEERMLQRRYSVDCQYKCWQYLIDNCRRALVADDLPREVLEYAQKRACILTHAEDFAPAVNAQWTVTAGKKRP